MMLKIKTKKNRSWKIIDNIRAVNYEYMNEEEMKKRKAQNNRSQVTTWFVNVFKESVSISPTFCEIMVVFDNKIEVIYTDATVYILNNKGETCDSIFT